MELEFRNLTKKYNDRAVVNDITYKMTTGIYGLLGPNGAGKTTLIRLICGLQDSDTGGVFFNKGDIRTLKESYVEEVGYLPQKFVYYPEFTAFDFLLYMSAVKGMKKAEAVERIYDLLKHVGLSGRENDMIVTYSGGMRQRLGIAQAMLNNPSILILDEPTAGLDPKERIHLKNLLGSFADNKIIIISTHIVTDIENIANQVIVMDEGKILVDGTPRELMRGIEGKVWECEIPNAELDKIIDNYTVSSMRNNGNISMVRIVSPDKPFENASTVLPNMEDVYLFYFKSDYRNGEDTWL